MSQSRSRLNTRPHSREGLTRPALVDVPRSPVRWLPRLCLSGPPGPFSPGIIGRNSSQDGFYNPRGRRKQHPHFLGTPVALPFHDRINIVSRIWIVLSRGRAPTKPREEDNDSPD